VTVLPATECLLLGPGPSPVSPRVMAALGASPRSHLGPLAGRIWLVGLMGYGASLANVDTVTQALGDALAFQRS
jgi:aspartate aminotransferase-like enzyme